MGPKSFEIGYFTRNYGCEAAGPGFFTVRDMPPSNARSLRSCLLAGTSLAVSVCFGTPLFGQELPLQRDYPGSGRYECPAPVIPVAPIPGDSARAGQLASDANQAMIVGDLERVESLLAQAVELDPTSPDLAYRHASVLEDVDEPAAAMLEYCRAIALGVVQIGVFDSRERIDALHAALGARIPQEARQAFILGLAEADANRYTNSLSAFTVAVDNAPEWGAAVYNRALVYEELGFVQESLDDYRTYLELSTSEIDPILVVVSERIGLLEGIASVGTPSPTGALAVGMVPGMGHYYTGRPLGGTVTLLAAGASLAGGFMVKEITTLCLGDVPADGVCPDDLIVDELTRRPYALYGLGVAAVITVVGAIEASIKARRRRAEADAIRGPRLAPGPSLGLPTVSTSDGRLDLNLVRVTFR